MIFPIRISTAYRICASLNFLAIANYFVRPFPTAEAFPTLEDGRRIQVPVQGQQREERIVDQWRQEKQAEGADLVQPRCHLQVSLAAMALMIAVTFADFISTDIATS